MVIRCGDIEKHLSFEDLIEYNNGNPNLERILSEIDTVIRSNLETINQKM